MGWTSTKCASASLCLDELRSRCWHGFAVNAKHPHDLMTPKLFPLNRLLFKSFWWSFIIPSISRTPLISKTRNQVYYSCLETLLEWCASGSGFVCLLKLHKAKTVCSPRVIAGLLSMWKHYQIHYGWTNYSSQLTSGTLLILACREKKVGWVMLSCKFGQNCNCLLTNKILTITTLITMFTMWSSLTQAVSLSLPSVPVQ